MFIQSKNIAVISPIQKMLKKILIFLNEFDDFIFPEHKKLVDDFLILDKIRNQDEMINSMFGAHFTSCAWSRNDATEGPDTCACMNYNKLKCNVEDIIKKYYSLSKRL